MQYRAEIDGLRAIAVIPVILFHAGFAAFNGGFIGVDIFFVISGYLITTIILSDLSDGKFSLLNFYERRARRILPALFLVLLVCLPLAWMWLLPQDMKSFSQSLAAVSIFSSNIFFWSTNDYFATASELKPLIHTWSLAVEEQYYILFPIFLAAAWGLGKRWMLVVLIILGISSLLLAHWGSLNRPVANFYLLPTRVSELLAGVLLAFYLSSSARADLNSGLREAGGIAGLGMVLLSIFWFDKQVPFPGMYALVPIIGTMLIILFVDRGTILGKLLGNRLFVGLGLISYSAYLWHQILFAFARHRALPEPDQSLLGLLAVISLILAYVSWKFVEVPFRNKNHISRGSVFIFSIIGTVFFATIGLYGYANKGFPSRLPESLNMAGLDMPMVDNGWCFYSIDSISGLEYGDDGLNCWLGDEKSDRSAILFGDSFAGHYEPLWNAVGSKSNIRINSVTTNWCYPSITDEFTGPETTPALDQCLYNREHLLGNISNYDAVILSGNWASVLSQNKMGGVLDLVDYLSDKSQSIVLMPSPKLFDLDVISLYKRYLFYDEEFDISDIPAKSDKMAKKANSILRAIADKYPTVIYIERESLFSIDGRLSDLTKGGVPFSFDGKHISIYGSRQTVDAFVESGAYREFVSLVKSE